MAEKILDLGCGRKKHKGSVGLDKYNIPGVDIVHNMEKTPLPFNDNEFDCVIANHVLEHIENFFPLMEELWRITKPGGRIKIWVPHAMGVGAYSHPDHKRFFIHSSFIYFSPKSDKNYYSKARFEILKSEIHLINHNNKRWSWLNFLNPIINMWKGVTERILRPDELFFELKPVKK